MLNKTVLILGGSGLLGTSLSGPLENAGYEVISHSRARQSKNNIDFTDEKSSIYFLEKIKPDVVINLIAIADVDFCEIHPNLAYRANILTVKNISNWIKKNKECLLIHISTDQVYDGVGPHSEDLITLRNYYAFSKYAGELVLENIPCLILRTNFFGKSKVEGKASFSDWIYSATQNNNLITVFEDVFFSPLSMKTLANILIIAIQQRLYGLYNLGSRDGLSKAEFAYLFVKELGLPTQNMTNGRLSGTPRMLKAQRPTDMRLNCQKIEGAMQIVLPTLAEEINSACKEY